MPFLHAPWLLKDYQDKKKNRKKRYFIRILRSDRVVSEHALGILKGRFCIVYKKAKCPRQCKSCYHRLYCTSQFLYFAVWSVSPTLATQGGETHLIRKPTKRTQNGRLSQQVHARITRWLWSSRTRRSISILQMSDSLVLCVLTQQLDCSQSPIFP